MANAADHRAHAAASLVALVTVLVANLSEDSAVADNVVGLVLVGWLVSKG